MQPVATLRKKEALIMVIAEGKTKIIHDGPLPNTVIMKTLDVLTGGDAAKKEKIKGIGAYKTTQAANVFSLLNQKSLPTAFIRQVSPTELLCYHCQMLPMELVVRRYAFGSYLQRHPEYKTDGAPFRFEKPVPEFFHKCSIIAAPLAAKPYQMAEGEARSRFLHGGVWQSGVYTDPYIQVENGQWLLYPAKKPLSSAKPLMPIKPILSPAEYVELVEKVMLPTFLVLEAAWSKIATTYGPVRLVDLKIEVGRRLADGKIVIADVVDNDSWRIWPGGDPSKQLDKQCFRDDYPIEQVSEKYALVAQLTKQFV
jgi:phosphoribosylaminoimidazole-succinocarboxamide synthase